MTLPDAATAEAPLHAFWHGPRLPEMARVSLESFVELGHPITLHTYDPIEGVPAGVGLADAAKILPRDQIFIQPTEKSLAPFTDRFRYEMLAQEIGTWVDCDLLAVRPVKPRDYNVGWVDDHAMNGAVLHLPVGSPLLEELRAMCTTPGWIPPWYRGLRRLRYRLKYWRNKDFDYRSLGVGTIGPFALTHYVKAFGLAHLATAPEVHYPVPYEDTAALVGDPAGVRRYITPETECIHLWNSRLNRELGGKPPAEGSFYDHVLKRTWRDALGVPLPA